jgi:hypothetical protein
LSRTASSTYDEFAINRRRREDQSQAGGFDDFGSADAVVFNHANMI